MNIGFVTTWFERGAAYVTRAYMDLLKDNNNLFVFARGGEYYAKDNEEWNKPYVTWGSRIGVTRIIWKEFREWIDKNKIDVILFNEQHDFDILYYIKLHRPNVKIGAYIDYYKENTVEDFKIYDFLICNTKRHYEVFKHQPQVYYVPWGTDINKFNFKPKPTDELTFFHSAGMSNRKGTETLINTFVNKKLYLESKLIIHTQQPLALELDFEKLNIDVICKTVTAPGLYHLGDVYVYPTKLEGLGLTIFEALACGLPVITTNYAPMNEVIDNTTNGKLVDITKVHTRADGYYWPLVEVSTDSLEEAMRYYINNKNNINSFRASARDFAVNNLNWENQKALINSIFLDSKILSWDKEYLKLRIKNIKNGYKSSIRVNFFNLLPDSLRIFIAKFKG